MSIDNNNKTKLFGFTLNNTAATILFYISLITFIRQIPSIYSNVSYFMNWLSDLTIIEIISNIESLLYYLGIIAISIIIEVICFYILIKSILV
ncbi:MAG: hypothetical protein ACFFCE_08795 [Promethearchaeota archaeon]